MPSNCPEEALMNRSSGARGRRRLLLKAGRGAASPRPQSASGPAAAAAPAGRAGRRRLHQSGGACAGRGRRGGGRPGRGAAGRRGAGLGLAGRIYRARRGRWRVGRPYVTCAAGFVWTAAQATNFGFFLVAADVRKRYALCLSPTLLANPARCSDARLPRPRACSRGYSLAHNFSDILARSYDELYAMGEGSAATWLFVLFIIVRGALPQHRTVSERTT